MGEIPYSIIHFDPFWSILDVFENVGIWVSPGFQWEFALQLLVNMKPQGYLAGQKLEAWMLQNTLW